MPTPRSKYLLKPGGLWGLWVAMTAMSSVPLVFYLRWWALPLGEPFDPLAVIMAVGVVLYSGILLWIIQPWSEDNRW